MKLRSTLANSPLRSTKGAWPLMGAGLLAGSLAFPATAVEVTEEAVERGIETEEATFDLVEVVSGLEHGWGIAWLPDGRMLVTERPGRIQLIDGDSVTELGNLPKIHAEERQLTAPEGGSQGGLLDIGVHPDYDDNGWIYMTYSSPGDPDSVTSDDRLGTGTALARARLSDDGSALEDVETLYAQVPRTEPGRHYGSRLLFLGDGTVLFSIGDSGLRHGSQNLHDPAGAMIRINEDGGVPADNPMLGKEPGNVLPEIYSFGHRNNQGLAQHPETGEIWTTEHGPSGGDLLHRVQAGQNYGWPNVTQGTEYSTGEHIGVGGEAPGVEPPVHVWEESHGPSGLAIYADGSVDGWEGDLFAGTLVQQKVIRLSVEDGEVIHTEDILHGQAGRIRDVRQGPDGMLYLVTDEGDSSVYRLEPR